MADLRCSFAGIAAPNPFWLASAPPTDKQYNVVRAFKAGWGGVVWKTLGEDPPIANVTSRYGAVHLDGDHRSFRLPLRRRRACEQGAAHQVEITFHHQHLVARQRQAAMESLHACRCLHGMHAGGLLQQFQARQRKAPRSQVSAWLRDLTVGSSISLGSILIASLPLHTARGTPSPARPPLPAQRL